MDAICENDTTMQTDGGQHGSIWRPQWKLMEAKMETDGGQHGNRWRPTWKQMEANMETATQNM
eukprot:15450539-Alexandrium_andersonii.AAC.1